MLYFGLISNSTLYISPVLVELPDKETANRKSKLRATIRLKVNDKYIEGQTGMAELDLPDSNTRSTERTRTRKPSAALYEIQAKPGDSVDNEPVLWSTQSDVGLYLPDTDTVTPRGGDLHGGGGQYGSYSIYPPIQQPLWTSLGSS